MWRHRRRRVDVYLRGTVGHPADLISRLSRQLASASHSGSLHFSGADLIEAAISLAGVSSLLTTSIADANISEAKASLSKLVERVLKGEEGVIDYLEEQKKSEQLPMDAAPTSQEEIDKLLEKPQQLRSR